MQELYAWFLDIKIFRERVIFRDFREIHQTIARSFPREGVLVGGSCEVSVFYAVNVSNFLSLVFYMA